MPRSRASGLAFVLVILAILAGVVPTSVSAASSLEYFSADGVVLTAHNDGDAVIDVQILYDGRDVGSNVLSVIKTVAIDESSTLELIEEHDYEEGILTSDCGATCTKTVISNAVQRFHYDDSQDSTVSNTLCDSGETQWELSLGGSVDGDLCFNSADTLTKAVFTLDGDDYETFDFSAASFDSTPDTSPFQPDDNTCVTECFGQLDVVVVMDESSSINADTEWPIAVQFLEAVVAQFDIQEEGVHLGIVTFSTVARIITPLSSNQGELLADIAAIDQSSQNTNIGAGIELGTQLLEGGRSGVPSIMIVVTDGRPTEGDPTPEQALVEQVTIAHDSGLTVYAVAPSDDNNPSNLEIIANPSDLVSEAQDFDMFVEELNTVIQRVCPADEGSLCDSACGPNGICACGACTCYYPFESDEGICNFCPNTADSFCNGRGVVTDDCLGCECDDCGNYASQSDDCVCDCSGLVCYNGGTADSECACSCPDFSCSNGGTPSSEDCSCTCPPPFAFDPVTGDCGICAESDEGQCDTGNGLGFFDTNACACACPALDCTNGGEVEEDECACDCPPPFAFDVDTLSCSACVDGDDGSCNNNGGGFSETTCGCECNYFDCGNGDLNENCLCDCHSGYGVDGSDNQGSCTVCTGGESQCQFRGLPEDGNCNDCVCTESCANGGAISSNDCDCACVDPWEPNRSDNDDCTQCARDDDSYCHGMGTVDDDCFGCVCDPADFDCYNGAPRESGDDSNADRCKCECSSIDCVNGVVDPDHDDCRCLCDEGFQVDGSGNSGLCTECSSSIDCNGLGEPVYPNCDVCVCTTPCSNGGVQDPTTCECECVDPYELEDGDCTECTRSDSDFCNGEGDVVDCESCDCDSIDCRNGFVQIGGAESDGDNRCLCDCPSTQQEIIDFCGLGFIERLDADSSTGEVRVDSTCDCDCEWPWQNEDNNGYGPCNVCGRDDNSGDNGEDSFCQNRGDITDECDSCVCRDGACGNGVLTYSGYWSQCDCDCDDGFKIGDDNRCSECDRDDDYCNDRGEPDTVTCEVCDCVAADYCLHGVDFFGVDGSVDDDERCVCNCAALGANFCGNDDQIDDDPFDSDCKCECHTPWARDDTTGICTVCTNNDNNGGGEIDEYCHYNGEVGTDCLTCVCNANTCSNGGVPEGDRCQCSCPAPWGYDSGDDDCTDCLRNEDDWCNDKGEFDPANACRDCICDGDCRRGALQYSGDESEYDELRCRCQCDTTSTVCSAGKGSVDDTDCECVCEDPWDKADADSDCTICTRDTNDNGNLDAYCSGRGEVADDCETCEFCTCSNGGVPTDQCVCDCADPWTKDSDDGDCIVCARRTDETYDVFCNGRGVVDEADCETCICQLECNNNAPFIGDFCACECGDCLNGGTSDDSCTCTCPEPYAIGVTDGRCSVCDRGDDGGAAYCNNRGLVPTDATVNTDCSCECDDCSNGGTNDEFCVCTCPFPFVTGSDGNCGVCDAGVDEDVLCNNRGTINPDCSTCTCVDYWESSVDGECLECGLEPFDCLHNSTLDSNNCSCICDPNQGWSGDLCNVTIPDPDNYCENNGVFYFDEQRCICPDQWNGLDCSLCPSDAESDCENGFLFSSSSTCRCLCEGNWEGEDCDFCPVFTCDNGATRDTLACACACVDNHEGENCGQCIPTDCGGRGEAPGLTDPDCSCICENFWENDEANDIYDCSVCPDEDPTGEPFCNDRGSLDDDCLNCVCVDGTCANGGTPVANLSCACTCPEPWDNDDTTGDCTVCLRTDEYCNDRGELQPDCETCVCPDCSNNGTNDEFCVCSCPAPWESDSTSDCTVCTRTNEYCSFRGELLPDCETCVCPECSNGGTNDEFCACSCPPPFDAGNSTDCIICLRTDEYCNDGRGVLQLDCETCVCPDCANNGTNDEFCACSCPAPWESDNTTDCTVCPRTDVYCNDRGVLQPDCETCVCPDCSNGNNTELCVCICEDPWVRDGEGRCTVCPVSCPAPDELLDEENCECLTCPTVCDDFNDCTIDSCVEAECVFELIDDCVKCFNETDCDDCESNNNCLWVQCEDPLLVFDNGTMLIATDLDDEFIEDQTNATFLDDRRCIPALFNFTLNCTAASCGSSSTNRVETGAALGGGLSAGAGLAFFGAAWGLAAFRQNKGVPIDVPDTEFDATNAFVNDNGASVYVDAADGAMFESVLFETQA